MRVDIETELQQYLPLSLSFSLLSIALLICHPMKTTFSFFFFFLPTANVGQIISCANQSDRKIADRCTQLETISELPNNNIKCTNRFE